MRQKMLLSYNILPQFQQEYMDFMMNTFVPTLQRLGLENQGVWHTAYGNYPMRLLVFVAEQQDMQAALASDEWRQLEARLKTFITDYTCRIVPFQPGFQF